MTTLIKNIGEFFTGDLARPVAPVKSILIDDGKIAALDPPYRLFGCRQL